MQRAELVFFKLAPSSGHCSEALQAYNGFLSRDGSLPSTLSLISSLGPVLVPPADRFLAPRRQRALIR